VLEYKTIISSISTHLTPLVNDTYRNFVKNLNPYESVSNVVLNLPPPRYPYYQSSTFAENAKVLFYFLKEKKKTFYFILKKKKGCC